MFSTLRSKATPGGFHAMTLLELHEALKKAIHCKDKDGCKNILLILEKKIVALVTKNEKKLRERLMILIEERMNLFNKNEKQLNDEQIKKITHSINNLFKKLNDSVQRDMDKIIFFPAMTKSELTDLIASYDDNKKFYEKYLSDEPPIYLIKKYMQSAQFKEADSSQTIQSKYFLQQLSHEETINIYNYYANSKCLPYEQQSLAYKLLSGGKLVVDVLRDDVSNHNDKTIGRLSDDGWNHIFAWLNGYDLKRASQVCRLFRGMALNKQLTHRDMKKDYSMPMITLKKDVIKLPYNLKSTSLITLRDNIVAFSNGRKVSIGTMDNSGSFAVLSSFVVPCSKNFSVTRLAKSPSGQYLATLEENMEKTVVRIWEWQGTNVKQKNRITLTVNSHIVEKFVITEKAEMLIYHLKDYSINTTCFFDVKKSQIILEVNNKTFVCTTINGNIIVQDDNSLKILDKNLALVRKIRIEDDPIICKLTETQLLGISKDKIFIWNLATDELTHQFSHEIEEFQQISDILVLPDDRIAILLKKSANNVLVILELPTNQQAQATCYLNYEFSSHKVSNLCLTADRNIFVAAHYNAKIIVFPFYDNKTLTLENVIPNLHLAILYGAIETIRYSIENGANIDAKNDEGETALLLTARLLRHCFFKSSKNKTYINIIKYLIEQGANVHIRNNDGYSALALLPSTEIANKDIIQLLFNAGAGIHCKVSRCLYNEINLTNGLFLGAKTLYYEPTNRKIYGLEQAITNLEELKEALISQKIDCNKTLHTLKAALLEYPDDPMLKEAVEITSDLLNSNKFSQAPCILFANNNANREADISSSQAMDPSLRSG